MEMVEKTRRSMAVLRRCQEADREELNYWKRRCSEAEPRKAGGELGTARHSPGSSDSIGSGERCWAVRVGGCMRKRVLSKNGSLSNRCLIYSTAGLDTKSTIEMDHSVVWVGRDLKGLLHSSAPCHGLGCPPDRAAHSPLHASTGHLQAPTAPGSSASASLPSSRAMSSLYPI